MIRYYFSIFIARTIIFLFVVETERESIMS